MPDSDRGSALAGLKILDMTRVLAGPSGTQMLGDLGADVVKLERPGAGDDTRRWGPPFLTDDAGNDTTESAYYLSANRNKRSLTLDYTRPEGRRIATRLARRADVLVENYKPGTLSRYGLAYDQLKPDCPGLVYCSITGFGLTGPYSDRPGYDFLIQAMGGIMSITGEPDGQPMKVGVAIADLMAGMYATIAILAALRHRDVTGAGQHVDLSLLDSQVAWLSNAGQYFLTSGELTPRYGNAHPTIVPYQAFAASDGHFILAVGNDGQFARFCEAAGCADLTEDERFSTNPGRVRNREALVAILEPLIAARSCADWLSDLEARKVPCGPINAIDQVFADPQVEHLGMLRSVEHRRLGRYDVVGQAARLDGVDDTRYAPSPDRGEHTDEILAEFGFDAAAIADLNARGVV